MGAVATPSSDVRTESAHPARPPAWLRWRLTREGVLWCVAAVVMIAAGLIKLINLLILLGYFMLALVGVNAWLARRSAYRIELQRLRSEPVFAGQSATRFVAVTNTASRSASITVLETSPVHRMEVFVPVLDPDGTRTIRAEFVPRHRGRFSTSPLAVVAGYPFGLVQYHVPTQPSDSLIVLPAIGHVDLPMLRRWLIRTGAGDATTRRPVQRQSIHTADVRGLRLYRPGDSPREVHWRTTARRGTMMVREYDSTEPLDLVVVVEAWRPDRASVAQLAQLEATLSLAASVFWSWCHADEMPEATLVVIGSRTEIRTGRATEGFGRSALSLLAEVEPTGTPTPTAVEGWKRRSNRCARLCITSRPNSPLPGQLRSLTGVPFVTVGPQTPMQWYEPPAIPSLP